VSGEFGSHSTAGVEGSVVVLPSRHPTVRPEGTEADQAVLRQDGVVAKLRTEQLLRAARLGTLTGTLSTLRQGSLDWKPHGVDAGHAARTGSYGVS
jgi:hypothetical protein